MSRSRAWVYTWNNYDEEDEAYLQGLESKYHVYGREVGESGTPHLQGTIYFTSAKTFNRVKKMLPGAHIEVCVSLHKSIEYCKKDGNFFENGIPPVSNQEKGELEKKRYERAWELAKEGRIEEIDADIRLRHLSTLKRIKFEFGERLQSRDEITDEWFVGPSGSGKSKTAREENPDYYIKNPNKWWDNYHGQACVIIDEWSPSHEVLADFLKKWCDHYPFSAEIKGGTTEYRPAKIVVTSNYTIEECFPRPQDHEPLKRRFTVRIFPENVEEEEMKEFVMGRMGQAPLSKPYVFPK